MKGTKFGISNKKENDVTKSVYTYEYNQFRKMLIAARKSTNLTQAELSIKLQRPQSYVSKYERGERRLDLIEFLELAEVLKIDPVVLFNNSKTLNRRDNYSYSIHRF